MTKAELKRARRKRAHRRVRKKVQGSGERPRIAVYKSLRYIYAQVIDDVTGRTLAQASSFEPEIRQRIEAGTMSKDAARIVGEVLATRAKEKGVKQVVFDRGGYVFHGRVRELAEAARANGLQF